MKSNEGGGGGCCGGRLRRSKSAKDSLSVKAKMGVKNDIFNGGQAS